MKKENNTKPAIIIKWERPLISIFLNVKDCLLGFNQQREAYELMYRFLNPADNIYSYLEAIELMEEYVVILNRNQCPY